MPFLAKILLIGISLSWYTPVFAQRSTDEEKVRKVIVDAFQALADIDIAKFRSYCHADFVLLENGEVWTLDTLEAKMKPRIGSGMKRINTIDFGKLSVGGATAWVTYHNQADIELKGQKRTIRWLESAVLDKVGSDWKLAMLHSTVIPKRN